MKKFIIFVLAGVLSIICVEQVVALNDITIDVDGPVLVMPVSPANETMLTKMLTRENARRAAQQPPLPALTLNEFLRDVIIIDGVRGLRIESRSRDHIDACVRFHALSAAAQATELARAAWQGDDPCP